MEHQSILVAAIGVRVEASSQYGREVRILMDVPHWDSVLSGESEGRTSLGWTDGCTRHADHHHHQ